jgi:hypothetical protein
MIKLLIALTAGLFAVSALAGQPAEYNKATTITGTLVFLKTPFMARCLSLFVIGQYLRA